MFDQALHSALNLLALAFIFVIGCVLLTIAIVYVIDVTQTRHSIRRNYPVIGRFRYWFEHLGDFFRQYFFALDREELPFNRAIRSWVYRAAKGVDTNIGFGSTRKLSQPGEVYFLNSAFPVLDEEAQATPPLLIGPYARVPYAAPSFFNISAMSYGALSKPALLALSQGAAKAGCWMNTGEGGLAPEHLAGGCDLVFQIGTAKYGVRDAQGNLSDEKLAEIAALPQVKMFEIKLSQGAKPGKGGILPAEKVTPEIAAIRGIPVGEASISPNRHREVATLSDLLDLIERVRQATGKPTGIKFVLGDKSWFVEFCQVILERGIESAPDFITLDSADGGSGAAPQPLMDYVGLPLKESLLWLIETLEQQQLRERIRVIASGKLVTPAQVAMALAVGADFVASARGFMFSLGCIQAMQCHQNTCPTGIATHNLKLQKGLDSRDKSTRVANYHKTLVHETATIAHSCGASEPRQLRPKHLSVVSGHGNSLRADHLIVARDVDTWVS